MADENKNDWVKQLLKALLIVVVVLVAVAVIGFGLLVGFCALGGH
jgi:chromate transport protein ChrA